MKFAACSQPPLFLPPPHLPHTGKVQARGASGELLGSSGFYVTRNGRWGGGPRFADTTLGGHHAPGGRVSVRSALGPGQLVHGAPLRALLPRCADARCRLSHTCTGAVQTFLFIGILASLSGCIRV